MRVYVRVCVCVCVCMVMNPQYSRILGSICRGSMKTESFIILLSYAFSSCISCVFVLQRLDEDGIVEASMGANSDAFFLFSSFHAFPLQRGSMNSFLARIRHMLSQV